MKDITAKLIHLLKKGHCTPKISELARMLKEPSTTIHYNIKKLEKSGTIKSCKAVLDHRKAGEGFCSFVLLNLSPDEYGNPETIARELLRYPEIESIDIITGDWEMALKIRTANQDSYYNFVRKVISRKGVVRVKSLISLRQVKSEFVALQ